MKYSRITLGVLLFVALSSCAEISWAQHTISSKAATDSTEVMKQVDRFLEAFTKLEWQNFTDCFSADATAFFPPSAKVPLRANNKAEIESIFQKVFDGARARRSSPPYLDIHPLNTRVAVFDATAIVTFHLEDPGMLGRRTIVFRKEKGTWKIVHLHASGITTD